MALDPDSRCCGGCRWWHHQGATLSKAGRNPAVPDDVGTCQVMAPQLIRTSFGATGYWPETHESRVCGEYMPNAGGPDGGEEVPSDNVVQLRDVA